MEEQIALLQEHELHSSAALLTELLLSNFSTAPPSSTNTTTSSTSSTSKGVLDSSALILAKFRLEVTHANSLFQMNDFRRAEAHYLIAIQMRKDLAKAKVDVHGSENSVENLRHSLAQCYIAVNEYPQALNVLSEVSVKLRNAKINSTLGKLYERTGNDKQAISCFKDLLKECPLALDSMKRMIHLGSSPSDILALVSSSIPSSALEWLQDWLEGIHFAKNCDFQNALQRFSHLENTHMKDNSHVLSFIATCQWRLGLLPLSKMTFEKALEKEPMLVENMDVYAHVLAAFGREAELNRLCVHLQSHHRGRSECWVALARFCQLMCENNATDENAVSGHAKLGLTFIDKAIECDNRNAEIYLAKGMLLNILNNRELAVRSFFEALSLRLDFAAYQGIVSHYLLVNKVKEALKFAKEAQQRMPKNPRAATLYSVVCARTAEGASKAKKNLDAIFAAHPTCLDTVFAIVDYEVQTKNYKAAIDLLKQKMNDWRPDLMCSRIADICMTMEKFSDALKYYQLALKANPDSEKTRLLCAEATRRLEGAPDAIEGEGTGHDESLLEGDDDEF